ncbi:MAG TPA: HTTM domain-containing protein [Candidatus Sulfotelmatobacter sp.]|nr:HTTM domain-containing protein [Candidatus Sulfotelmatobacter sp.]
MTATENIDGRPGNVTSRKATITRGGWLLPLRQRLATPVEPFSLAAFRILFGSVMCYAMVRFLARGWVKMLYLDPVFHFPWVPFIQPWPGIWMYVHVVVLAICALGITLGLFYRISAALFCVGFTYLEFLDRTAYLNHYYLAGLLSFLLIWMPANCQWSLDVWLRPELLRQTVPLWTILLLRFQLIVVYLFAGLAKLNTDWLFAAEPLRIWLMASSDLPLIGPCLAEPWAAFFSSWFGVAHDLLVPVLLLFARTRPWAYLAAILFHLTTAILFPIGMFPWIMLASTTIFFSPGWPRALLDRLNHSRPRSENSKSEQIATQSSNTISTFALALIAIYCFFQVLVPLRSWLYPQQGAWDVRGFNFAWRVMLVEKTGYAEFFAVSPLTGDRKEIPLSDYITPRQQMMMAQDPFQIRALAQFLGHEYPGYEIHVDAFATLNGRPSQRIVRDDVNLASSKISNWIVPLAHDPN